MVRYNNNDKSLNQYLKDISKYEALSTELEHETVLKAKAGDITAQNKLVRSNLKIVVKIAKEYQGLGMSLNDLINEGNSGLIKAIKYYDPTKGFKFVTYSVCWVRQKIMYSIYQNSRLIRLPTNIIKEISRRYKEEGDNNFHLNYTHSISYDDKLSDNEGDFFSVQNNLFDPTAISITKIEDNYDQISKTINFLLKELDSRERKIIESYYGINTETSPMTLEDIGDMFSITKERVRQIKNDAIRKLRLNDVDLSTILNL